MTQYARPNGAVSATNWTGSYTDIDETPYSDSDYIVGSNSANGTFICTLSAISEPATKTACTIKFRARKSAAGGHARQVSVQVYEGATARGSAVASGDLTETWTEYSSTSIDLSAVTDWSALRFNIVSSGTTGTPPGDRRYVWLSWGELSTPDAAGTATTSTKPSWTKGQASTTTVENAWTKGSINTVSTESSWLQGSAAGTPVVSTETAWLKGQANTVSTKSAYLSGKLSSTSTKPAWTKGSSVALGQKSAWLKGQIATTSTKPAWLQGGGASVVATKSAWILGIDNILVPVQDSSDVGLWENQVGGTTDLYQSIDEKPGHSDTDYIRNTDPQDGDYYECALENPAGTPGAGDVVILWRAKDNTGSGHVQATAQLRQGTSTVIASMQQILTSAMKTYYLQLTPAEKANITDWNDLRVRITLDII